MTSLRLRARSRTRSLRLAERPGRARDPRRRRVRADRAQLPRACRAPARGSSQQAGDAELHGEAPTFACALPFGQFAGPVRRAVRSRRRPLRRPLRASARPPAIIVGAVCRRVPSLRRAGRRPRRLRSSPARMPLTPFVARSSAGPVAAVRSSCSSLRPAGRARRGARLFQRRRFRCAPGRDRSPPGRPGLRRPCRCQSVSSPKPGRVGDRPAFGRRRRGRTAPPNRGRPLRRPLRRPGAALVTGRQLARSRAAGLQPERRRRQGEQRRRRSRGGEDRAAQGRVRRTPSRRERSGVDASCRFASG